MKPHTTLRAFLCFSLLLGNALPAAAGFESGLEYYRTGDYAAALQEFKADATVQSKFYLSLMYQKGDGTPQDRAASLAMLREAAEGGLDVAQASLGMLYVEGAGVQIDEEEGLKWLGKAAAQGLPEAVGVLSMLQSP